MKRLSSFGSPIPSPGSSISSTLWDDSSPPLSIDLSIPPAPKRDAGTYCFYTKKKDEAEMAHQEEQVRMVMLMLYNWFSRPASPASAASHRNSLSLPVSPSTLYANSVLTALPLTYTAPTSPSTSSHSMTLQSLMGETDLMLWRKLAEAVYAELAESPPGLVQSEDVREVAKVVLRVVHGMRAPEWVHRDWRRGRAVDARLLWASVSLQRSGRWFEVVISGGGPVGLTVAMLLAHCSATSTSSGRVPSLRIRIYDQRWTYSTTGLRWRHSEDQCPNTRRRQVITLQDYVVALLDEGFKCALPLNWSEVVWPSEKGDAALAMGIDKRRGAERVYVNSRQAPIRDVEDRLLMEIRDSPVLSRIIELVPAKIGQSTFEKLRGNVDLFIGADGASGKAFTVNYRENGELIFEREVLESHQTDRALGIPINCVPKATQAEIVFLTLCQTIYLLNSTSNGLGFLNIRLSQDLYDSLAAVPPADRTFAYLLASKNPLHSRIIALIDAGFRLYGMDISKVVNERIDIFRLALASAPRPVQWVQRDPAKGRSGGMFPMVLTGDAAMQHNFWPGRGANSGLLSAWSLCANVLRSFEIPNFRGLVDAHMAPYEGFMRSLKVREHDGRGRFIQMIDIERIYAVAFPAKSIPLPELHQSRDRLVQRALLWRDRLGTRPEFTRMHPVPVPDAALVGGIDRMCGTAFNIITQNTPMAIMDSAILQLLEGSQEWPTSEMNPLGYDLSPKGFVQPSVEEIPLDRVRSAASSPPAALCPPRPEFGRRRSGSNTAKPPEPEYAVDTHPAWLAMALLGQKPEFKAWGNTSKNAEKAYKKAIKDGFGSKYEQLYSQAWDEEGGLSERTAALNLQAVEKTGWVVTDFDK